MSCRVLNVLSRRRSKSFIDARHRPRDEAVASVVAKRFIIVGVVAVAHGRHRIGGSARIVALLRTLVKLVKVLVVVRVSRRLAVVMIVELSLSLRGAAGSHLYCCSLAYEKRTKSGTDRKRFLRAITILKKSGVKRVLRFIYLFALVQGIRFVTRGVVNHRLVCRPTTGQKEKESKKERREKRQFSKSKPFFPLLSSSIRSSLLHFTYV